MPIISQYNYLKEIYKLEEQSTKVSVSLLSKILEVTQPSVTQQLRALSNKKLIEWKPRSAIKLTRKGERWAVDLIRKHRVIESFLVQFLEYNPLQAHVEAEEMEHLASDQFVEGLLKLCGNPKYDPHGDPIPDKSGRFPARHNYMPLENLPEGRSGEVAALSEADHKILQTITEKNLAIGSKIERSGSPNSFLVNGKKTQLSNEQINTVYLKGEKR
jgi:DtxR family Mn-dependent transcriptional regulator